MIPEMVFVLPALYFVAGACFGSFGSVIMTRFSKGESIGGRSRCPACGKQLRPWELVPLLSFLFLHGGCARCHARIGVLYPLLELASGALFVVAFSVEPRLLPSLVLSLALWTLLVIAVVDFFEQTIPDILSFTLACFGLGFSAVIGQNPLGGILLGAGFFTALWCIGRGKWIGTGDIILGAAIGTLLADWRLMAACLFLTYVGGAAIASVLLILGKVHRGSAVAFGPFLAIGTLMTILWRTRIIEGAAVYFGVY